MKFAIQASMLCSILIGGCAELSKDANPPDGPQTRAAALSAAPALDPAWREISQTLERGGSLANGVYTIAIPRDDLDVTIGGMSIPTEAGIETAFHFYRCPCGKMNVAGQFVTTDYESNDVLDALRQHAALSVASVGPLFLYDNPRLVLIRFQGEGEPNALAKNLREALRWTARERMAPQKTNEPSGKGG